VGEAVRRWAEALAAWALPEHITAAVTDSPWVTPTDVFARRADHAIAQPAGASFARAAEALAPSGTMLDVGAGAGAASLPHAPHLTGLTAVDSNSSMLEALAGRAADLTSRRRLPSSTWSCATTSSTTSPTSTPSPWP
jgi:hypothetical protein